MTELDYAWAAGIMDGEGCISLNKKKNGNHGLSVKIKMTHLPTLQRFQEIFSGSQKIREDTHARKNGRKSGWSLTYSAVEAVRPLLEKIEPYSVTKKDEVRSMLLYISLLPRTKKGQKKVLSERFYQELRELKRYNFTGGKN